MIRLKKWALPVTGLGVTLALVFATPRAAHAVVAALVQVTNTASNPAVTQDTSHMASQMVHLTCYGTSTDAGGGTCYSISPSAEISGSGDYFVPSGQSLIVTSVDIYGTNSSGSAACPSAMLVRLTSYSYWQLTAGEVAVAHYSYPSGIPLGGVVLNGVGVSAGGSSCSAAVQVYGYLTAN